MDATLRRSGSRPGTLAPLAALVVAAVAPLLTAARLPLAHPTPAAGAPATAAALALPVQFEQNQGQADPAVRFLAPTPGGTLFLTQDGMVLSLTARTAGSATHSPGSAAGHAGQHPAPAVPAAQAVIRMGLVGGAASPQLVGLDPQATSRNYMVGDRSQWHLNVPTFARVAYRNVYPGVDLVFHGESGAAEYDFVVAPGASPAAITLRFQGQHAMRLDDAGNLVLDTALGSVTQHRPVMYQEAGGARHPVSGGYHLLGGDRVAFDVGQHDPARPLVIDPVLGYSTYLGGGGTGNDGGEGLTVDSAGNAYIAGWTQSADFPVTTQLGPRNTSTNAYVLKLNAAGSMVTWSTVFGGGNTQGDEAAAVALDPSGDVWTTGFTHSTDFPTTPTAFKPVRTCQQTFCPESNAFVTEFNPLGGTILYSSYLGGGGGVNGADFQSDVGTGIAVDGAGKAYVSGGTSSPDFPTTSGAFQTTYPGVCCHQHGFVAKFDGGQVGSASLVYSTFLGGTNNDGGWSIAVDGSGNAWVGGSTNSTDYPTTVGAYQRTLTGPGDGVVTGLNAAGSGLRYSTFLGGSGSGSYGDNVSGLALGPGGKVYVDGGAASANFPTTPGAYSRTFSGGDPRGPQSDAFLAVLNPAGGGSTDLTYSTYFGGSGNDWAVGVAVDASGNGYLFGETNSPDLRLANPVQGVWAGAGLPFANDFDLMIAEIRPAATGLSDLLFSSYLGGTADENPKGLALGPQGALYSTGATYVPATPSGALLVPYPTTRGAVRETWNPTTASGTGFVTKLDLAGTTALLAVPGSDGSLYTKSDANPYQNLGGVLVAAPSLVAVPGAAGALPTPLFIAVGSDHNLYVRSLTRGWQTLSSSPVYCIDTAGATVTTTTTGSTLTVACQGSDHGLWYAQGTVTAGSLPTVSGWQGLGGTLSAGPAVGTVAGNLTFLVLGSNGQVYSRTTSSGYTATGWGCIGHVALASYRTNAYFACQGSDHALWYSVNPGSGWVQVQSAGGVIADSPAIVATPAEVIIDVEGSNKAVYHVTLSPGGGPTTPWVYDGGSIQFGPGATTLTP